VTRATVLIPKMKTKMKLKMNMMMKIRSAL